MAKINGWENDKMSEKVDFRNEFDKKIISIPSGHIFSDLDSKDLKNPW